MQELPPQLHPLITRLEQTRSRLQIQRGLDLLAWVGIAAVGLWIILWAIEFFSHSGTFKNQILTAFLVLGIVAVGIYLRRNLPSLQDMARFAEKRFDLKERLSTALEVVEKPSNPFQRSIYQALLQDAANQAIQLEPKRLVRFAVPKHSRYLGGLVLVAALLYFVPTGQRTNAAVGAASTDEAKVATQLQKLSQVVQQNAERTNDPYLQAEARHLEQLRSQIKQGQLKGDELQQQVGSTLERLGQNYSLSPSEQNPTKGGNSSTAASSKAVNQPGGKVDSLAAVQRLQQQLEQTIQRLQTQPQQAGTAQSPAGTPPVSKECIFVEGYECLTPDQLAQLQQGLAQSNNRLRVQGPDGGTPGGSGGKAGKGTQSKLGAKLATPQKTATKQVILPKQTNKSLRRIQISAPTQVSKQFQATEGRAGQWKFGDEIAVPAGLQSLDAGSRRVVGGYFAQKDE